MDGPRLGVLHHRQMKLAALSLLCRERLADHSTHVREARKLGGTNVKDGNRRDEVIFTKRVWMPADQGVRFKSPVPADH